MVVCFESSKKGNWRCRVDFEYTGSKHAPNTSVVCIQRSTNLNRRPKGQVSVIMLRSLLVCILTLAYTLRAYAAEGPSPAFDDWYLTGGLFSDYHKECPAGLAVTSFDYEPISSSDSDTFNRSGGGIVRQDISLRARCTRHIDDRGLTFMLSSNVSTCCPNKGPKC